MCPFCNGNWVTFSKKRGTHFCNYCRGLNATPEEYERWYNPNLPLNEKELLQVAEAQAPQRIVVQRLLATLKDRARNPGPVPRRKSRKTS